VAHIQPSVSRLVEHSQGTPNVEKNRAERISCIPNSKKQCSIGLRIFGGDLGGGDRTGKRKGKTAALIEGYRQMKNALGAAERWTRPNGGASRQGRFWKGKDASQAREENGKEGEIRKGGLEGNVEKGIVRNSFQAIVHESGAGWVRWKGEEKRTRKYEGTKERSRIIFTKGGKQVPYGDRSYNLKTRGSEPL